MDVLRNLLRFYAYQLVTPFLCGASMSMSMCKGWFTRATQTQTQTQTQAQGSSHVQRKRKHSAIRKRNRVFQDVLVLLFFLFLGLRRIRRRRLIRRNNKSRLKRLWVREIFRKRQLFPFLSQHLSF